MSRLTEEQKQKIVDLYVKGYYEFEIVNMIGCSRTTVDVYVKEGLKNGTIKERHPRLEYGTTRQRSWNRNYMPCTQAPEKPEGITVKCTKSISKSCVYGCMRSQTASTNLCNYILIEGHMRGCPPEACTKYSKVKKGNPKRVSIC